MKSLRDYENLTGCPIATGFKILGKRWTIEVVRELLLGSTKFNELLKNAPGINPRMLSLRLKELEGHRLVERRVVPENPVRIDYSLTNVGRELIPVMFAMAEFSMRNFPGKVFADGKARSTLEVLEEIRAGSAERTVERPDSKSTRAG